MDDVSQSQQSTTNTDTNLLPGTSHQTANEMSANMTETVPVVVVDDFLSTGRTGRRNALADILDEKTAYLSTADLPDQLQSLSFGPGKLKSIL